MSEHSDDATFDRLVEAVTVLVRVAFSQGRGPGYSEPDVNVRRELERVRCSEPDVFRGGEHGISSPSL